MKLSQTFAFFKGYNLSEKSFILQLLSILPIVLICVPTSFNRTKQFGDSIQVANPFMLLWTIIPFVFFCAIRIICAEKLFVRVGDKFLMYKSGWTESLREFRVKRFGLVLMKGLYFFTTTPLGIVLFRNEDWFPKCLYGRGDISNLWNNFPNQETTTAMTIFYCWELGYHLHSLVFHIYGEHGVDFLSE